MRCALFPMSIRFNDLAMLLHIINSNDVATIFSHVIILWRGNFAASQNPMTWHIIPRYNCLWPGIICHVVGFCDVAKLPRFATSQTVMICLNLLSCHYHLWHGNFATSPTNDVVKKGDVATFTMSLSAFSNDLIKDVEST